MTCRSSHDIIMDRCRSHLYIASSMIFLKCKSIVPDLKPSCGISSPSRIKSALLSRAGAMLPECSYLSPLPSLSHPHPSPDELLTVSYHAKMPPCFLNLQGPFSILCCTVVPSVIQEYLKCHILQESILTSLI